VSWGTSTDGAVPKDAIDPADPTLSDAVESEQREQLDVATQAARALARVVGRPGDHVRVSLTGHANPEHAPRDGWANEMITVSVSAHPSTD
jgi:hypothetical protein